VLRCRPGRSHCRCRWSPALRDHPRSKSRGARRQRWSSRTRRRRPEGDSSESSR